jgi:hypothetical protein
MGRRDARTASKEAPDSRRKRPFRGGAFAPAAIALLRTGASPGFCSGEHNFRPGAHAGRLQRLNRQASVAFDGGWTGRDEPGLFLFARDEGERDGVAPRNDIARRSFDPGPGCKGTRAKPPGSLRYSSQRKRLIATNRQAAPQPISTKVGNTAASNGRPRQVAPSSPSTAQRVGR